GDPETQPILMRLQSDLTLLCEAALSGALDSVGAQWDRRAALGVVMAAAGYPDQAKKGDVIEGLERAARPGAWPGPRRPPGTREKRAPSGGVGAAPPACRARSSTPAPGSRPEKC